MKSIILIFLSVLILSSCSSYETNKEIIDEAYNFNIEKDLAVIYILRDFESVDRAVNPRDPEPESTDKPTSLQVGMFEMSESSSRNKQVDAMNTLDGDSVIGAGISYNFYRFHQKAFARFEMPPDKYSMFSAFLHTTQSQLAQSRKIKNFDAGKIYFFNITSKPIGPYSSTVFSRI